MRRLTGRAGQFWGTVTVLILLAVFPVVGPRAWSESAVKNGVPLEAASYAPATDEQSGDDAATQTTAKPAAIAPKDLRQAEILADTDRLLRLAQELKVEVSKSNKEILSLAVVKKADEIEKLAKRLKEKMKTH